MLRSAAVGYGRRRPDATLPAADRAQQAQIFVTCSENSFTNPVEQDDAYRTPLPGETRTYELTGLRLEGDATRFGFESWRAARPGQAAGDPLPAAGRGPDAAPEAPDRTGAPGTGQTIWAPAPAMRWRCCRWGSSNRWPSRVRATGWPSPRT